MRSLKSWRSGRSGLKYIPGGTNTSSAPGLSTGTSSPISSNSRWRLALVHHRALGIRRKRGRFVLLGPRGRRREPQDDGEQGAHHFTSSTEPSISLLKSARRVMSGLKLPRTRS